MGRVKWFTALSIAVAVGLAFAGPASAATRDLYLVSTDGYVYLPGNGDGTCGVDVNRITRGLQDLGITSSFDFVNGTPTAGPQLGEDAAGYCRTWIRGFAAANGPVRESRENDGNGKWYPPNGGKDAAWDARGKATLPAPILDVTQGDQVFLHLANIGNGTPGPSDPVLGTPGAPNDPHTIHLHGQATTTQNDGFPESSWVVPVGSQAVYYFFAENPGSYMYHCHVEASEHVQMGMYGAFIIRPLGFNPARPTVFQAGPNVTGTSVLFNDDYNALPGGSLPAESIMLLSDVDTTWHRQVEYSINPANAAAKFQANYWLLNGRSFPDTLRPALVTHTGENVDYTLAGFSAQAAGPTGPPDGWLPGANHYVDYHTIIDINGFAAASTNRRAAPPRVLVRLIDMSFTSGPMHFHGWHFVKVGEDGQPVPKVAQKEEFTVASNSGKTYELIITAFPRNAANLAGSLYGNQSPPAPGIAQPTAAGTAPLPNTNYPELFTNGFYTGALTNPAGSAPVMNATDDGTLNAGGEPPLFLVAGLSVPGGVNATTAPFIRTKLPEQILTIAPILYGPGTLGGGTITYAPPLNPDGTPSAIPTLVTVSALSTLNPFPVPNNITDLWYPTHDHHDYKVTNNGLYPGGVVALIHAH